MDTQLAAGAISPEDLNLLIVTDSVDEIRDILVDCYKTRAGHLEAVGRGQDRRRPARAAATAPDPAKADAQ